jgi:hypothetical protein
MAGLKSLAAKIADKGRHGDSALMHIQPGELATLEAMLGRTTINPETGLPEAFSWKKLLAAAGLIAAAIPTGGTSLLGALGMASGLGAGALGTIGGVAGANLLGSAFKPGTKKDDEKKSEAGEYIAKRNAEEAAKNKGVPLIQANINPYVYQPGGREQQQIGYGAPRPMSQGIQSLMGTIDNSPARFAGGGMMEPEEAQARQVLERAMAAMQGNSQDPHADLSKFIETYGEEAFQNLAGGGMVKGPGSGLDDMVSAQLGNQKVLLSNDEFVLPADVVSGLGDGSSEAGARKLHAMMRRVRQERTGTAKQPGKISDKVMPR